MDKEEKQIDINIDEKDNRAIEYNYDSLGDPTSDSYGSFEDYFNKCMRESRILEETKKNKN